MGKLKRLNNFLARQKTQNQAKIEAAAQKIAGKVVQQMIGKKPTLASVSRAIKASIRLSGATKMRQEVIAWIESDIAKICSENPDKEKARTVLYGMMETAIATPEYVDLLKAVDMNPDHVKVLIDQATQEQKTDHEK